MHKHSREGEAKTQFTRLASSRKRVSSPRTRLQEQAILNAPKPQRRGKGFHARNSNTFSHADPNRYGVHDEPPSRDVQSRKTSSTVSPSRHEPFPAVINYPMLDRSKRRSQARPTRIQAQGKAQREEASLTERDETRRPE